MSRADLSTAFLGCGVIRATLPSCSSEPSIQHDGEPFISEVFRHIVRASRPSPVLLACCTKAERTAMAALRTGSGQGWGGERETNRSTVPRARLTFCCEEALVLVNHCTK